MSDVSCLHDAYLAADRVVAEWMTSGDERELSDVLRERFVITFRESAVEMDRYIIERIKEERGHEL